MVVKLGPVCRDRPPNFSIVIHSKNSIPECYAVAHSPADKPLHMGAVALAKDALFSCCHPEVLIGSDHFSGVSKRAEKCQKNIEIANVRILKSINGE